MAPAPRRPCYVSVAYTHAPSDPRVRRHCETLARHGWRVYQLGIAALGEARVGRLNGVILVRWRRPRYRGGRLVRYAWSYCAFLIWARRVLRRVGRRRAVAVVQVNNIPNFLVLAAGGARRRGARAVLDIHDPEPELFLSKFGGRAGARVGAGFLRAIERAAARSADGVICVHDEHRAVTAAHGVPPGRVRVVMNYADERLFRVGPPRAATPFFAYHGTVASRMGLDVVLRAVRQLRDEGIPLRGAIWGDGDAAVALRRLRDELGLADAVEIPAQRFRPEALLPNLARVGVGVVPVRRDVFTDVMLPTKVLEYARLGIPVVVTWTPTVARYLPEDAVFYVRDFTPSGVAAALRTALQDPAAARQRAARAQAQPIAASWQENERAYVEIIKEVAGT